MLTLSMALWNAAVMNVDEREKELTRLASKLEGEMHQEFWQLTRMMMERHRTMFPDLHGTRAT